MGRGRSLDEVVGGALVGSEECGTGVNFGVCLGHADDAVKEGVGGRGGGGGGDDLGGTLVEAGEAVGEELLGGTRSGGD